MSTRKRRAKTADPLAICLVSSEYSPLVKTGGLADVTGALAAHLHGAGHDVRTLIPAYSQIDLESVNAAPVPGLENLSLTLGTHVVPYSILQAKAPQTGTPVYLLHCPAAFDRGHVYTDEPDEHLRFLMLTRCALEMCQRMAFAPDIVHCNDWQTAMLPLYLRSIYAWDGLFAQTRTVLTIHNIGYQGAFPSSIVGDLALSDAEHHLHQDDLKAGVINFLKTGILYASRVTTVSPRYAEEIANTDLGMGMQPALRGRPDPVVGILNGVDYAEWSPGNDAHLPARYDADDLTGKTECKRRLIQELKLSQISDQPLLGIVSRLVYQKGIDLLRAALPPLLARHDFGLAALGSGEDQYEQFFTALQQEFPGRVCFYRGYNEPLAHWIEAGSDIFLMPSRYEPCGLNQMYSLAYGTVPVVRETGGLADSVQQIDAENATGTGILFREFDAGALTWAIERALALYADRILWRKIMRNGMRRDFSWQRQGREYEALFRELAAT